MDINVLGFFRAFGISQSIDFDAKSVFLDDHPSKYFLFESEDNTSHDEEIFISGRTVIWSSGQVVKKSFTLEYPVIKAIWASFALGAPKNHLCILHRGGLSTFGPDGSVWVGVVPCQMSQIWPLPQGIMLERATFENEEESIGQSLPNLFSLLHPLEEIKPLSFQFDDEIGTNPKPEDYFVCCPSKVVVWSSYLFPFIVIYDKVARNHSIYVLRKTLQVQDDDLTYQRARGEAPQHEDEPLVFCDVQDETLAHERSESSALVPITSQIFIEQIWESNVRTSCATQIFLCSNLDDTNLTICLFLKQENVLEMLELQNISSVKKVSQIDGVLAVTPLNTFSSASFVLEGMRASVPKTLLIATAQTLGLYKCNEFLCEIRMPSPELLMKKVSFPRVPHPNLTESFFDEEMTPVSPIHQEYAPSAINQPNFFAGSPFSAAPSPVAHRLDRPLPLSFTPGTPFSPGAAPFTPGRQSLSMSMDDISANSTPVHAHHFPSRTATGTPKSSRDRFPHESVDTFECVSMSPDSPYSFTHSSPIYKKRKIMPQEAFQDTPSKFLQGSNISVQMEDTSMETEDLPGPVFDTEDILVVDLHQNVGNRFNFNLSSGASLRGSLSLRSPCALVNECFETIECVLSPVLFYQFLIQFVEFENQSSGVDPWRAFELYVIGTVTNQVTAIQQKPTKALAQQSEDSAWEYLLSSQLAQNDASFIKLDQPRPQPNQTQDPKPPRLDLKNSIPSIINALHLLYENSKLSVLSLKNTPSLRNLLCYLSSILGWHRYVDYYGRDAGGNVTKGQVITEATNPLYNDPPSVMEWVMVSLKRLKKPFPLLLKRSGPSPTEITRKICLFYSILCFDDESAFSGRGGSSAIAVSGLFSKTPTSSPSRVLFSTPVKQQRKYSSANTCEKMALSMVTEAFDKEQLKLLPFGVALPLLEGLELVRAGSNRNQQLEAQNFFNSYQPQLSPNQSSPQISNPPQLLSFELSPKKFKSSKPPSTKLSESSWPLGVYSLIGREDLAFQGDPKLRAVKKPSISSSREERQQESDILKAHLQAKGDKKPGTKQPIVKHTDGMDLIDTFSSMRFSRDQRLKTVRTLLSSATTIPLALKEQDDNVQLQQTSLLAAIQRVTALPIGRGAFTLGSLRGLQPLMTEAIEIPPLVLTGRVKGKNATIALDQGTVAKDEFVWPSFHNGVAAGLRIACDQIEKISSTWIAYNKAFATADGVSKTEAHAGLLMALGLQGHLKVLLFSKVYDYLSNHSATGSIISLALLIGMASCRVSSKDQAISKLLSVHIPSLHPPSSPDLEVSPLVQTAAILGLGLLYMETSHRRMAEVLLKEIGKKPTDDKNFDRESYSLAAGFAFGMVTLGTGNTAKGLSDLNIEARLLRFINGGKETNVNEQTKKKAGNTTQQPSNIVLEGGPINLNVTSPSATIALALMYLKTNNHQIAEEFAVPSTQFQLEYVQPDMLLLSVLARNLILWDQIGTSVAWIEKQMPPFIRSIKTSIPVALPQQAGMEQAYLNIVCGCCFAVGLRFAGTFSPVAKSILVHYLNYFIDLQKNPLLLQLTASLVDRCVNVCALCLSIVMAGTGDLDALRILRKIIKRGATTKLEYGSSMALSMALGFLFLGGGGFTFSNSNQAVAVLLCSIYPRFPSSPTDNRYHLQAFRHLYVLASEQRSLECRDIETEDLVYIPLTIKTTDLAVIDVIAPCLLPPIQDILSITVEPPRYWSRTLFPGFKQFDKIAVTKYRTIYVKRKSGYLSYNYDPDGQRSLPNRSFPKQHLNWIDPLIQNITQRSDDAPPTPDLSSTQTDKNTANFISSFCSDPNMLAFAKNFCKPTKENQFIGCTDDTIIKTGFGSVGEIFYGDSQAPFCTALLYECLTQEKQEALNVYLSLYQITKNLGPSISYYDVMNIKTILSYYENDFLGKDRTRLIDPRFMSAVKLKFELFFQDMVNTPEFRSYLQDGDIRGSKLGSYLGYSSIPIPALFNQIVEWVKQNNPPNTTLTAIGVLMLLTKLKEQKLPQILALEPSAFLAMTKYLLP